MAPGCSGKGKPTSDDEIRSILVKSGFSLLKKGESRCFTAKSGFFGKIRFWIIGEREDRERRTV